MSGTQVLTSFFADQVSRAETQLDQARTELESAQSDTAKLIAQEKLSNSQAYFDIATKTKELFDNNRLTERRLKEVLETLRRNSNG